jgi:flavin reductase (DIM6/NTAB) family NADH-FMN oxidoreductase RutF
VSGPPGGGLAEGRLEPHVRGRRGDKPQRGVRGERSQCRAGAALSLLASKDRPRGLDAFRGVDHHEAVTGSPLLDGAVVHRDCRLDATNDAGDHLIFIGEVLAIGVEPEARPLIFHGGSYHLLRGG